MSDRRPPGVGAAQRAGSSLRGRVSAVVLAASAFVCLPATAASFRCPEDPGVFGWSNLTEQIREAGSFIFETLVDVAVDAIEDEFRKTEPREQEVIRDAVRQILRDQNIRTSLPSGWDAVIASVAKNYPRELIKGSGELLADLPGKSALSSLERYHAAIKAITVPKKPVYSGSSDWASEDCAAVTQTLADLEAHLEALRRWEAELREIQECLPLAKAKAFAKMSSVFRSLEGPMIEIGLLRGMIGLLGGEAPGTTQAAEMFALANDLSDISERIERRIEAIHAEVDAALKAAGPEIDNYESNLQAIVRPARTGVCWGPLFERIRRARDEAERRVRRENPPGAPGSGGLQDVICTESTVILKVWDHGEQDGDLVTLMLGNEHVLSTFNLDGCGGAEPSAGPCVQRRALPLPTKISVVIKAHNEGSVSPNTASLKVDGGCTPELQNYRLTTGQTAAIQITRSPNAPKRPK